MQNASPKYVDLLGLLKAIPADKGKGELQLRLPVGGRYRKYVNIISKYAK